MGYYEDKKRATTDIDSMLKDGKTETDIVNVMQLKYGFDRLMVQRRIMILHDLGVISIKDGKITVN